MLKILKFDCELFMRKFSFKRKQVLYYNDNTTKIKTKKNEQWPKQSTRKGLET